MTTAIKTILVVDDDLTAIALMRAALQKAGFAVSTALDGMDGLRQFRAKPSDIVLLDVDMPGMSGYEVCAALRLEAGPLLPIVMVTGFGLSSTAAGQVPKDAARSAGIGIASR